MPREISCHFLSNKLAEMKQLDGTQHWQGFGETGPSIHYSLALTLVQTSGKAN